MSRQGTLTSQPELCTLHPRGRDADVETGRHTDELDVAILHADLTADPPDQNHAPNTVTSR
jgi:hypothetical protein